MLFINVRYLINVNISLYNFRQALESPKSSNSIGCICPKNTFLQVTHYIQRIYLTLLSTTVKIHQIHFWDHKLIFAIQIVCLFLAQTLHTSDKNIPLRCYILLTDKISLSDSLNFLKCWAICALQLFRLFGSKLFILTISSKN